MPTTLISNLLKSDRLFSIDSDDLVRYNRKAKDPYRLHPELGSSAYEGDIDTASLVLLLANPGFNETSTHQDHTFQVAGWPLAGLHPDAPLGLRTWWHARLKWLIQEFGAQHVSKSVACLQLTPWASSKFDESLRLPSRKLFLEAANRCAERGAVMLVMRGERFWLQAEVLNATQKRFRVNSWRSSYVSPGNISSDGWHAITRALRSAR